jgi:hypothetical protein
MFKPSFPTPFLDFLREKTVTDDVLRVLAVKAILPLANPRIGRSLDERDWPTFYGYVCKNYPALENALENFSTGDEGYLEDIDFKFLRKS